MPSVDKVAREELRLWPLREQLVVMVVTAVKVATAVPVGTAVMAATVVLAEPVEPAATQFLAQVIWLEPQVVWEVVALQVVWVAQVV